MHSEVHPCQMDLCANVSASCPPHYSGPLPVVPHSTTSHPTVSPCRSACSLPAPGSGGATCAAVSASEFSSGVSSPVGVTGNAVEYLLNKVEALLALHVMVRCAHNAVVRQPGELSVHVQRLPELNVCDVNFVQVLFRQVVCELLVVGGRVVDRTGVAEFLAVHTESKVAD